MSKLIAVCGSPESGKTTLGLKLAQEIYFSKKTSVLFFSVDLNVPVMGYVFPHCKASDLHSIGKTLDKTDIYREDVMKQIVTVKTMMNFGYLGFKAGENKYSYPRPTEDKVLELFRCMTALQSYRVFFAVDKNYRYSINKLLTNDNFRGIILSEDGFGGNFYVEQKKVGHLINCCMLYLCRRFDDRTVFWSVGGRTVVYHLPWLEGKWPCTKNNSHHFLCLLLSK